LLLRQWSDAGLADAHFAHRTENRRWDAPMEQDEMERVVGNLDRRIDQIGQILPTLATKHDLPAVIDRAVEPLATKAEVRDAKMELRAAFDKAVEPLATTAELRETQAELRAALTECEHRLRTHFDAGFESLRDDIRLIADGLAMLSRKVDQNHSEARANIAGLDRRLMRVRVAQARS